MEGPQYGGEEPETFSQSYHKMELIGEGSFGKVYKCRKKGGRDIAAVKFIVKRGKSHKDIASTREEIRIQADLCHENVIRMKEWFETDDVFCMVTEFAQGQLFEIMEDDGALPESEVRPIAQQRVAALQYLHSHRIIHRDMKPQNILIGQGGTIKLCDFGFARALSSNTVVLTSIKGTPLYMAPEVVQEQPYNHTADLWSLGVILYELHVGQPPFYTNSIYSLVKLIVKNPVVYPDGISPRFQNFLEGLLQKQPRQRLDWPRLAQHPFVAGDIEGQPNQAPLGSPDAADSTTPHPSVRGSTPEDPPRQGAVSPVVSVKPSSPPAAVEPVRATQQQPTQQQHPGRETPPPPSLASPPQQPPSPNRGGTSEGGGGGRGSRDVAPLSLSRLAVEAGTAPSSPGPAPRGALPVSPGSQRQQQQQQQQHGVAGGEALRQRRPCTAGGVSNPSTAAAGTPGPGGVPSYTSRLTGLDQGETCTEQRGETSLHPAPPAGETAARGSGGRNDARVAIPPRTAPHTERRADRPSEGCGGWEVHEEASRNPDTATELREDDVFVSHIANVLGSATRGACGELSLAQQAIVGCVLRICLHIAPAPSGGEGGGSGSSSGGGAGHVLKHHRVPSLLRRALPWAIQPPRGGTASILPAVILACGAMAVIEEPPASEMIPFLEKVHRSQDAAARAASALFLATLVIEARDGTVRRYLEDSPPNLLAAILVHGLGLTTPRLDGAVPACSLECATALRRLLTATPALPRADFPHAAHGSNPTRDSVFEPSGESGERGERASGGGSSARIEAEVAQELVASPPGVKALTRQQGPLEEESLAAGTMRLALLSQLVSSSSDLATVIASTGGCLQSLVQLVQAPWRPQASRRADPGSSSSSSIGRNSARLGGSGLLWMDQGRHTLPHLSIYGREEAPESPPATSATGCFPRGSEEEHQAVIGLGMHVLAAVLRAAPLPARRLEALGGCGLEVALRHGLAGKGDGVAASGGAALLLRLIEQPEGGGVAMGALIEASDGMRRLAWLLREGLDSGSEATGGEGERFVGAAAGGGRSGIPVETQDGSMREAGSRGAADWPLFLLQGLASRCDEGTASQAVSSGIWHETLRCLGLSNGGLVSPEARLAGVTALYDLACKVPSLCRQELVTAECITVLAQQLDRRSLRRLVSWPPELGGGPGGVANLTKQAISSLYLPFTGTSVETESYNEAVLTSGLVSSLLAVLSEVELQASEPPVGMLARLVLSHPSHAVSFVQEGGIRTLQRHAMGVAAQASQQQTIGDQARCPDGTIVDALAILSHLARGSSEHYIELAEAGVLPPIRGLLRHASPAVRAKAANLLGNLCRHDGSFYPLLERGHVIGPLIEALRDFDTPTRKFASLAIGNAAFHSAALYGAVRGAIPGLVALLSDPDEKVRSNAAGALGNLSRNSGELTQALVAAGAVHQLLRLLREDPSLGSRKICLFSLGNMCQYSSCREVLLANGFEEAVEGIAHEADEAIQKFIARAEQKMGAPFRFREAAGGR